MIPGKETTLSILGIEELADGMKTLIEQNVEITKDGLYKSMTNLLGFNRTGEAITERYDEALTYLLASRKIEEKDGVLLARTQRP